MINIGGNPLMILIGIIIGIQGFYLLFLAWIRPDIARYQDSLLGTLSVLSGCIILAFNFRMDITTQLGISLLWSITAFSIFETVKRR